MRKLVAALVAATALVAVACEQPARDPSAQRKEAQVRQSSYEGLVAGQPAKGMSYSPTRSTVNYWIETWDEPKKLAYVYLLASNGQLIGYYVFEGPPVSMCASLTPTYKFTEIDGGEYNADALVPAPSVDGVYYSGGQCNQYYGRDATSGAYMEFSIGGGINYLLYDQPLPRQDVEPLGFSTIEEVKK